MAKRTFRWTSPEGALHVRRAEAKNLYVVYAKMRAHRWEHLGAKGHTDFSAMWSEVKVAHSLQSAQAAYNRVKHERFGDSGRTLKTEFGDNSALADLTYYTDVLLVEAEEIGEPLG